MSKPDWQVRSDARQRWLGLAVLAVALLGAWWVERRRATTLGDLARLRQVARPAPLDRLDPSLEGRAVHAVGTITSARLTDDLGVVTEGLRLVREVRMLCWDQVTQRYEDSDGKTRTRKVCKRVWSTEPGDCCFRHSNPHMPLRSVAHVADGARLGPYRITRAVAAEAPLRDLAPATPPRLANLKLVQVDGGWRLGDPSRPEIGDLQIDYRAATPPPVPGEPEVELTYSVLAAQRGDALVPWIPPGGGSGLALVAPGRVTVSALVTAAVQATSAPWWWRVVLLAVAWAGVQLLLGTLDLDWREDLLSFVASGGAGLGLLLLVGAAAWRDATLVSRAASAALVVVLVMRFGTHRR